MFARHDPLRFAPITPGGTIPDDWYAGHFPENIEVGEGSVADSTFCFKQFFAIKSVGARLGRNVTLWRTSIAVEEGGLLEIGDDCFISNASLVCAQSIVIGSRVMIAGGVTIADSDFHPIGAAARLADTVSLSPVGDRTRRPTIDAQRVSIANDVWIGYNATILKGVAIGAGAIVSPGAVVLRDVDAGATVSGNPAHVVDTARS